MRYVVIINDGELRGMGDDPTLEAVADEVWELLRSGYYEVEEVTPYGTYFPYAQPGENS